MSAVLWRWKSGGERRLFWDADSWVAGKTGCALPCAYESFEARRLSREEDEPVANDTDYQGALRVAKGELVCRVW